VGSATLTVNQGACSFGLNQTTIAAVVNASTGALTVSSPASCGWTATSTASWVTITSGAAGSGNGTVAFSVAGNIGTARSGTITVGSAAGSASVTINQAACSYNVSPNNINTKSDAIDVVVTVTTSPTCVWTAGSNVAWVATTSGFVTTGSGTAGFKIATNTTEDNRTGTLTVAGQTVTVRQDAPKD